jgi:hypothetical protein
MVSKKGAIELSMTTIIVIVIGITLLTLGLTWVRGIFDDLEGVTTDAFDEAQGAIGDLSQVEGVLTVTPDKIRLKQNNGNTIDVIAAHTEDINLESYTLKVSSPADGKTECVFADNEMSETSKTYNLASGKSVRIKMVIIDHGAPLGFRACNVEIEGTEENSQLIIEMQME